MIDGLGAAQLALYRAAVRAHQRGMPATAVAAPDSAEARTLTQREAGLLVRHALRAFAAGDRAALLGLPAPRTVPDVPAAAASIATAGRDAALTVRILAAMPASLAEVFPGAANHHHLQLAADVLVRRLLQLLGSVATTQQSAGARPDRQPEPPVATNPHQFVPIPVPVPPRKSRGRGTGYADDAGQDGAGDDADLLRALLAAIRRYLERDTPDDHPPDAAPDEPLTLDDWLRRTHGPLTYGPDGGGRR